MVAIDATIQRRKVEHREIFISLGPMIQRRPSISSILHKHRLLPLPISTRLPLLHQNDRQTTDTHSYRCRDQTPSRSIGDLRRRLSRRLSRQSATESPSRRRLVGDWSATQSPTSRHELFSKNIIPTYVRIVRRTSDRILQLRECGYSTQGSYLLAIVRNS